MDFVDRVLAVQGDSPIEKFSLKCRTGVDSDRVNQWICNVLKRGVCHMDLSIRLGHRYLLPSEVFMSRTLVELKIKSNISTDLRPGHVSLPMLKTLTLDSVWPHHSYQLQGLLSACPALEELDLQTIRLTYVKQIVSSASLRTLTIDSSHYFHAFSFDTPNLLCLKYSELVSLDYPLVNLDNLVEAHIKLMLTLNQIDKLKSRNVYQLEDGIFQELNKVQKLFRGIRNVQKLYLSPGALQVLALCCQVMPTFNNLTFLDIDSSMDTAWQAMPVLLRNTPRLETLVIKGLLHCVTDKCGDACICISRKEKGRSLASCPVKRLEIRWFEGITREMEMIKHFYDSFPCLKEMVIHVKDGRPRFLAPRVPDSNPYKGLSGRNVKVKVHGSLHRLWTAQ